MADTATTFEHLSPANLASDNRPFSCDLCSASEIQDILDSPIISGTVTTGKDLIPMYVDERDQILVCQRCAESGAYLEIAI